MEQVILTQLSIEELRAILREEIGYALRNLGISVDTQPREEILDIDVVCGFLDISILKLKGRLNDTIDL